MTKKDEGEGRGEQQVPVRGMTKKEGRGEGRFPAGTRKAEAEVAAEATANAEDAKVSQRFATALFRMQLPWLAVVLVG
jgi:hypothetical protein